MSRRNNSIAIVLVVAFFSLFNACNTATFDTANNKTEFDSQSNDETDTDRSNSVKRGTFNPDKKSPNLSVPDNQFKPVSRVRSIRFVNSMRVWKDSENLFSTNAELLAVAMSTQEIRLLKDNGVAITVPIARLSVHDKNFVTEFISIQRNSEYKIGPKTIDVFGAN